MEATLVSRVRYSVGLLSCIAVVASASCKLIEPVSAQVNSLVVSPSAVFLKIGDSLRVTATPLDPDGVAVDGVNLTWRSEDSAIVSVSTLEKYAVRVRALAAGRTEFVALASQGTTELTVRVPASVTAPELAKPLYVLDPCSFADSAAFWTSSGIQSVVSGGNTGSFRPTIDNTVGPVPWNTPCTRALLHRYNLRSSESQSAYDWQFGGSLATTKRVWYKIWVKMSDSLRVASDWKSMFLFTNIINSSTWRYRFSFGHSAAGFSFWQANTITDATQYGMQLSGIPNGYQERGELPPKGQGRFQGDFGTHQDAQMVKMKEFAFTGAWRQVCVLQSLPDTPDGVVVMRVWNQGVLTNDSDSSATLPRFAAADSLHKRYFSIFSFGRNGELFFVDPQTNRVIRETAYVHSGRLEIYNVQPSEGCG